MQRIKSGDTVEIITGSDKAEPGEPPTRGEVLRVDNKTGRVVVERVNVRKKHQRPMQAGRRQIQPGIIEFEAPIDASNVMLVCPQCDKATRVGFRVTEDGKKVRTCKKCGQDIDLARN